MKKVLSICCMILLFVSLDAKDNNSTQQVKKIQKLVWPSPPDKARIEYINSIKTAKDFGIEKGFFSKVFDFVLGNSDIHLKAPFGVYADKNRIYITDIGKKALFIFDKKENKVLSIYGNDKANFLYPIDVITDTKGNIYLSDSVAAKVYVFSYDGEFKYIIHDDKIKRPVGLALSEDNKKLFISDPSSSKIHVTTLDGKYLYSIGMPGIGLGEFNRQTFIEIKNDKLYVCDSMNHRIQILDLDGNYISSFGELGQNIGDFGSPRGITVDSYGNIYVSDTMYNVIQIFNEKGRLLMVFGHYGERVGEFSLAEDIIITDDNIIYITDTNNKRVQAFKLLAP